MMPARSANAGLPGCSPGRIGIAKVRQDGQSEVDDLLNERIADLEATRVKAHAALERARSARGTVRDNRPILIERFTRTMRERLSTAPVPARKALLGSLIDRIEVDDREVRIVGRKEALEHASWQAAKVGVCFKVLYRIGGPGRA